ncbi:MAG: D-alanyl-D-alanine carboxypeptidase, partial [Clostridia bacterium]|nr:D-alanyl-D-alanine carboxypeptidase [Clostridia bacterium]
PDTPEPAVPVFTGGTVPAKPHTTSASQTVSLDVCTKYVTLINAKTGEIVASLNHDVRFSPASMTKVMTLIVMCEKLTEKDMDVPLTMTDELYTMVRTGSFVGTENYGIDVDDQYKIKDLLYGIGMESASDCTMLIVDYLCESQEEFAELMNQKVEALGLQNTKFDNPVGYESENNYTTANDMAVIMAYAMQSELIKDVLGKEIHTGKAAGYNKAGEFLPEFNFTFFNTFTGAHEESRESAYEKHYKVDFSLSTAKLLAGKTGYWEYPNAEDSANPIKHHCLSIYLSSKSDKTEYVLIIGGGTQPGYRVMKDITDLLDTYVK